MNRLQRMLIVCSLASFVAGLGVGLAVPAAAASMSKKESESSDQRFVRDYVQRLDRLVGLSSEQVHVVRAILAKEREQQMQIRLAAPTQSLSPELQGALMRAKQQMDKRILHVLDDEQRAAYRRAMPPDGSESSPLDEPPNKK